MNCLLANGMANFATSDADAGFLWYDASTICQVPIDNY
jgi:hypothetical protein